MKYWSVGYHYFGSTLDADTENREIVLGAGEWSTYDKALEVLEKWAKMKKIKRFKEKLVRRDGKTIIGKFMTFEGEETNYDGDWYYAEYMEISERYFGLDDEDVYYSISQKDGMYDN